MLFGLIGGKNIAKYTIADYLWSEISHISGVKFNFKVFPIESLLQLYQFYWQYLENDNFIGFNIALPWKSMVSVLSDQNNYISKDCKYINTAFKKNGLVRTANTDVIGVEKSLKQKIKLVNKSVLILGGGGAGYPTAIYLLEKYGCKVSIFDIRRIRTRKEIFVLPNYESLISKKYDIIINASPVGKYFLNNPPKSFTSPLNADMFGKIIKLGGVVLDMNYFPYMTELLKIGKAHSITTIPGTEMLVYQALESLSNYIDTKLTDQDSYKLIESVNNYSIKKRKTNIWKKN